MVTQGTAETPDQSYPLKAGAGRRIIDLGGILPHDGFATIVDDLAARVLVIDGGGGRVALVGIEVTSIPARTLVRVKQAVTDETGLTDDQVIVVASHTFSAPHVHPADAAAEPDAQRRNDEFEGRLVASVAAAAQTAVTQLTAARVEVAGGECQVAVNRDVEMTDGWGLGINEAGPTDPAMGILTLRSSDRTPIAILANVAVQPSVMNGARGSDGGLLISGDIAGAFCTRIEDTFPGSTVFFLPGAAGDQAPRTDPSAADSDPRREVDRIADLMGSEVARALSESRAASSSLSVLIERRVISVPGQRPLPREEIIPTRSHHFIPDGPRDVPIAVLRIGGVRLLCVQPELSVRTGQAIRSAIPAEPTFIVTMADGAAKYMPESAAYPRFTYEALSSSYAEGAAETVVAEAIDLLKGPQ